MHTATDQTLLLIQKSKYTQLRYELESDTHLAPTYPVFSYSHFTTFRYIYSIRNSFKDDATFTMFIQMMYQLLLSFKFPFKCRKIMAVGPSDSGKTTWIGPILEVMDPQHVASITTETPFGAQMITASTQLLFVDFVIHYTQKPSNKLIQRPHLIPSQDNWRINLHQHQPQQELRQSWMPR